MRMYAKERNLRAAAWAPVVGLAGTVEGYCSLLLKLGASLYGKRYLSVLDSASS
jgi:hypothetical protein